MTTYLTQPSGGCTSCGSQDTATVDGFNSRRCAAHPPVYSRGRALALVDRGHIGQACAYLRAMLAWRIRAGAR